MQGGGVCIFEGDCADAARRPVRGAERSAGADGHAVERSRRSARSPTGRRSTCRTARRTCSSAAARPATSRASPSQRFGAVNVRAALRYVRDVLWRELDATTAEGYRADQIRMAVRRHLGRRLRHPLQLPLRARRPAVGAHRRLAGRRRWRSTTARRSASPRSASCWSAPRRRSAGARSNYLPPYCFATNCGVGPVLLDATAPRLKAVPEQQFLVLSNQVDSTQVEHDVSSPTGDLDQHHARSRTATPHGTTACTTSCRRSPRARTSSARARVVHRLCGRRRDHARLAGQRLHRARRRSSIRCEEGTLVQDVPGRAAVPLRGGASRHRVVRLLRC